MVDLNAIRFQFADAVGGDDLERPPNGHATPAALERCRKLIPQAVAEVAEQLKRPPTVKADGSSHQRRAVSWVQFGQGLIEQVDDAGFQAAIEAVSPGTTIMRSQSTYASEEAGGPVGGEGCAQQ